MPSPLTAEMLVAVDAAADALVPYLPNSDYTIAEASNEAARKTLVAFLGALDPGAVADAAGLADALLDNTTPEREAARLIATITPEMP